MEQLEEIRRINPNYYDFLVVWQEVFQYLILLALIGGGYFYLRYLIKYSSKKSYKEKFDFISTNEIKQLHRLQLFFGLAIFFFINTVKPNTVALHPTWVFIRLFLAICFGVLYYYIANLILKFYWPKKLHRKMDKLRKKPRINPSTGNKMKLLSESEEDTYLDEGMQAEEDVFSVDYDVWIDEETQETHIEKYAGYLTAKECDRCGFQTLRVVKEELIRKPTTEEEGILEKVLKCSYCNRVQKKDVTIQYFHSRKNKDSYENDEYDEKITGVKIEIVFHHKEPLYFDFESKEDAIRFLEKYE